MTYFLLHNNYVLILLLTWRNFSDVTNMCFVVGLENVFNLCNNYVVFWFVIVTCLLLCQNCTTNPFVTITWFYRLSNYVFSGMLGKRMPFSCAFHEVIIKSFYLLDIAGKLVSSLLLKDLFRFFLLIFRSPIL